MFASESPDGEIPIFILTYVPLDFTSPSLGNNYVYMVRNSTDLTNRFPTHLDNTSFCIPAISILPTGWHLGTGGWIYHTVGSGHTEKPTEKSNVDIFSCSSTKRENKGALVRQRDLSKKAFKESDAMFGSAMGELIGPAGRNLLSTETEQICWFSPKHWGGGEGAVSHWYRIE